MQAIKLDFSRSRAAPRWIAPALLLVAIAFAGDVAGAFLRTVHDIAKSESALARVEPHSPRSARKVSPEELAAARETMRSLSTPWDKLFAALESASSDQVALLAIEPDPKSGTVRITGDSKDYLAALTYVLNLSRAPSLSGVELVRHEVKQNDPQKPVTFIVSATWGRA